MLTVVTAGRAIAKALPHLSAYDVIDAAASVVNDHPALTGEVPVRPTYSHNVLVAVASGLSEVGSSLHEGKKINAIKVLRDYTACGLKEAKDAVEALADPWSKPREVRDIYSGHMPF